MNVLKSAVFTVVCLLSTQLYAADEFDADSILSVMKRVAKYRMTYADIANLFNHTSANKGDKPNQWAVTNQGADWDVGAFFTGFMALCRVSKDTTYINFAKRWSDKFFWKPCYNDAYATHADRWCCMQTYSEFYLLDPKPANNYMFANTKTCVTNFFDSFKPNPVYTRNNGWWWCDALYMAPPAISLYCKISGENRFLDSLNRYWWATSAYLYNSTHKFWYRDDGTKGSTTFWSGGNAWVIGGLVRVLEYMPENYANRNKFETQFKDMCDAIRKQQGFTTPYDGMWTTSMLNHTGFPGPESIGTAYFCYAFAWGVRNGLLDSATYTPSINKAWRDLVKNIKPEDGRLLRCQHVDWGPTNMETNGDYNNSAPEGEGAFLLAGEELYMRAVKNATAITKQKDNVVSMVSRLSVHGQDISITIANPQQASVRIFNSGGRMVADLSEKIRSAGSTSHSFKWEHRGVAPGVYTVVLNDGSMSLSKNIVALY